VSVNVPGRGKILDGIDFAFKKGMRVGIVGPNGAGKSTLLKTLSSDLNISSGEVLIGADVSIGYLSQEPPQWDDPSRRVMQVVSDIATVAMTQADDPKAAAEMTPEKRTAQLLKNMNFDRSRWSTPVGMLSGGENRRIQLIRILAQRPNFLMLDEPTNDLDAVTVDALEQQLQSFPGTVVLVSHDRSLLDGVCKMFLVMQKDGSQPKLWDGSHAELREFLQQVEKSEKQKAALKAKTREGPSADEKRRATKTVERAEKEIEKIESKLEAVDAKMVKAFDNAKELNKLVAKRAELEEAQSKAYEKYELAIEAC